jgi:hypothetical protein
MDPPIPSIENAGGIGGRWDQGVTYYIRNTPTPILIMTLYIMANWAICADFANDWSYGFQDPASNNM